MREDLVQRMPARPARQHAGLRQGYVEEIVLLLVEPFT
jgi:hypothetical protein